jgi:hypothetical protein
VRVSVNSAGEEADQDSYYPSLSSGGRYVVFQSTALNLVSGDTNNANDIFVHDRDTEADGTYDEPGFTSTTRISVSSSGEEANDDSYAYRSISEDGRFVVYHSLASNLAGNDTNGLEDVYLHDNQTGVTSRISVASDGTEGNGDSYFSTISANGKYVVFQSDADNLVSSDTNITWDCFRHENQVEGKYKVFLSFTRK